ncbi:MAG: phosphoribosylglycinamide formyltransferase [Phycisphaerales bacterium]|nr:phosphoribosylglycinamide formyltransferase [Phycisphaerales bacterium]
MNTNDMDNPVRVACLISGGGRSVVNLQQKITSAKIPARIVLVAATRANVAGIPAAAALGLEPCEIAALPAETLDDRVDAALEKSGAELIVLAGYVRLFRVARWKNRCINIHPSLLPKFGGRGMWGEHVHNAVIAAGEIESGCTVHWADEQFDKGSIILQRRCPIDSAMDAAQLAARVFEEERQALPEAVARVAHWLRQGGTRPNLAIESNPIQKMN